MTSAGPAGSMLARGAAGSHATIAELVAAARDGSVRATARLLTIVEGGGPRVAEVAAASAGLARNATVIGVTGAPGAGKSTLTGALLRLLRGAATGSEDVGDGAGGDADGAGGDDSAGSDAGSACDDGGGPRTVAVLAVDPSSPFSGGALLGDRVRMAEFALDTGVFIRSLSSRGRLGGLSAGTPAAVDLMSALGYDVVIIETVGVGQSEVDVMNLADTVTVVLAPGMGDAVQAAKAGILEIADLLVVNKADRDGARATMRELRSMAQLAAADLEPDAWRTPILATEAERGVGVPALLAAMADHREYLRSSGELAERRARRAGAAVESVVWDRVRRALDSAAGREHLAAAARGVAAGETDYVSGADGLVAWLASPEALGGDRRP